MGRYIFINIKIFILISYITKKKKKNLMSITSNNSKNVRNVSFYSMSLNLN